jgi:uncharacterized protein (TIGR03437 family)
MLLLIGAFQAQALEPVIAYSARVGPDMSQVSAVSVDQDGSVYLVGQTRQEDGAPPKFYLAKLTPDGSSVQCSLSLAGYANAIASTGDGAVILTGSTASPDFPIATSAQSSGSFLLRAEPCGQGVTYATWLPKSTRVTAVATSGGTVWVATGNSVLRYDIGAYEPAFQVPVDGILGAMTLSNGHLYVTGTRGDGPFRAFLMSLNAAAMDVEYDVTWGDGPVAAGTSLAVQDDGSVWVAGPAIAEGPTPTPTYSPAGGVPYWGGAAMLTRVAPGGVVTLSRVVSQPLGGRNPAAGFGADGRLWLAIAGNVHYPHNLPTSPLLHGAYLRAFDDKGDPSGGEIMIPGNAPPVLAFGPSGRLAVVFITPSFPLSPTGVNSESPEGAVTVVADLISSDAPSLVCDRALLSVPRVRIGPVVYWDKNEFACGASDDTNIPFVVSVVPASSALPADSAEDGYSTDIAEGATPASITVKSGGGAANASVVLLAPGVRGLTVIPVSTTVPAVSPRVSIVKGFDQLPGPGDFVGEAALSLSWEAVGMSFPVPFHLVSDVPWLTFEESDGVAPAEVRMRADASGMPRGQYNASVTIDTGGTGGSRISLPLRIGAVPVIQGTMGPYGDLQVPYGSAFTHTIQIRSTGEPLNFTIDRPSAPFTIYPLTGTTPAEITVVIDPTGHAAGDRVRLQTAIRYEDSLWGLSATYRIVGRNPVVLSDSISSPGAPGKRIYYQAGGASRCEPTVPAAPPWPVTLGGCRVLLNGQPLPLESVTESAGPGNPAWITAPVYVARTQLPYDVEGTVTLQFEDKDGVITSSTVTTQPVAPELLGILGSGPQEVPVRQPGESLVLLMTGLGATDTPAPLGDVPETTIRPVAPLEAFVGGRSVRILSAELSSTDPGVVAITVEIPNIAPDRHRIQLRIGGVTTEAGAVQVLPANDLPSDDVPQHR